MKSWCIWAVAVSLPDALPWCFLMANHTSSSSPAFPWRTAIFCFFPGGPCRRGELWFNSRAKHSKPNRHMEIKCFPHLDSPASACCFWNTIVSRKNLSGYYTAQGILLSPFSSYYPPFQGLSLFDLWIWRPALIISLEQLPEAMLTRSEDRCSVQPPWVLHSNMLHGVTINTQCEGHSSCCHAVWVWMCSDLLVHAHRLRHAHTLAHIFSLLHSQYTRVTLARGILGSEYSTEGNHFGCNAWKHLQCWQIRAHLFPLAFLLRDEWWWCKSATMQTGLPTFTLGSVLHAPWSSVWGWTPMFCKALPKLQSEVGLPVAVWGPGRDCQQSGLTGCSIFHLPGGAGGAGDANLQSAHPKTVL